MQPELEPPTERQRPELDSLTPREMDVAVLLRRGLTNRAMAAELGISPETVKRHLASIYSKLDLSGRVAVAVHMVKLSAAAPKDVSRGPESVTR